MNLNKSQQISTNLNDISPSLLIEMYTTMLKIRLFEEKVVDLLFADEIKCPTHLYIGEEAIATGVCANLKRNDYAFGTYRSHGFYIAKGGDLKQLMAELYGRETGCSRGRGGSMHIVAPEVGILGTTAIVGGTVPLAVGVALAMKIKGSENIVVSFFGDGATDEGVFYESINFASLKKLPVLFICENNFFSTHLPLFLRQPANNIYQRVKTFKMPSVRINGNDVIKVFLTAKDAIEYIRHRKEPFFIECMTYRWRAHVGPWEDIDVGFRTKKEVEKWKKRCPIKKLERILMEIGVLSNEEKENILKRINSEIMEAYNFAKQSPFPEAMDIEKSVFKF